MDTTMPSTSGNVINVPVGGDLQTALNNASCGDTIQLQAGSTYNAPLNGYTLPVKSCSDSSWIIIRTSAPDSSLPAPGTRIDPSYAPAMANIVISNSASSGPLFMDANGPSNHYRFVGLQLSVAPGISPVYNILQFGAFVSSAANLPNHIIFDRCWIHGNATGEMTRAAYVAASNFALIDSLLTDFHTQNSQSQGLMILPGSSVIKVENNRIESAGSQIGIGPGGASAVNTEPTDVTIRRNYLFKPLSWRPGDASYAGIPWNVTNPLESKGVDRLLIEGNVIENTWANAQHGFMLVLTMRIYNIVNPQLSNVTVRYNHFAHGVAGISTLNHDNNAIAPAVNDTCGSPDHLFNISIHDNLFEDLSSTWDLAGAGNSNAFWQPIDGGTAITFDHNTVFQSGHIIQFLNNCTPPVGLKQFVWTNNVHPHNAYGVWDGSAGTQALRNESPSWTFANNAVTNIAPSGISPAQYPSTNYFPVDWSFMVNSVGGDFHILNSSPMFSGSTDGAPLGGNMDQIANFTSNVKR